ncbi:hypothetical protein [Halocatena marina]|uniref:Uncharacterized protein n=1 Tax=Halocatena marina TaxID=2934937 RepID=A0ABD5YY29_9EURY|nr:hypothetical protein [Halocatena marina]
MMRCPHRRHYLRERSGSSLGRRRSPLDFGDSVTSLVSTVTDQTTTWRM